MNDRTRYRTGIPYSVSDLALRIVLARGEVVVLHSGQQSEDLNTIYRTLERIKGGYNVQVQYRFEQLTHPSQAAASDSIDITAMMVQQDSQTDKHLEAVLGRFKKQ